MRKNIIIPLLGLYMVLVTLFLPIAVRAEGCDSITPSIANPRMTEQELIAIYEEKEYKSLMDYWYTVQEIYGVFFRWDYQEKPIAASALSFIVEAYSGEYEYWPEL